LVVPKTSKCCETLSLLKVRDDRVQKRRTLFNGIEFIIAESRITEKFDL
jgi:hypothetical protein